MIVRIKSLEAIRDDYEHGYYTSKIEIPEKVGQYHVFDENETVKWNREMVVRHNASVEELQHKRLIEQGELNAQLTADIVSYIMDEYNMNKAQADLVQQFVYEHWHAFMSEYFSHIDMIASFADRLIEEERDTVLKSI